MKKTLLIVIIFIAILGLGYWLLSQDEKPPVKNDFSYVPPGRVLLANMQKAGLEPLGEEGQALHIHQHIDITINGQKNVIPANVGIGTGFISAMHTHDDTGILHVESPVVTDFKLSQFFDEWGIDFDDNRIGDYVANDTHKLVVGVNGQLITDVRNYVLKSHDQIHIWYGPKTETPQLIQSYAFPGNL